MKRSNGRHFERGRRGRRGVTLVEVILATLVVGVMMAGALATVSASQRTSKAMGDTMLAQQLANELLAEITRQAYSDATDTAVSNGATATELAPGNRSLFNDVNDYKAWTESPPKNKSGAAIAGASAWTRSVSVEFLTPTALTTPSATDQGIARITVFVKERSGTLATAVGVRSSGLPVTQACRLANSSCADLVPARCAELGGTAQGTGTTCWTLPDRVPATLVAQWKMDELLGLVALDSVGLHVATLANGASFVSRGGWHGNVLNLDGTNDQASVLHASDLSLTRKFTLCAWIHSLNYVANTYQYVLNKGTTVNGNQNYYLATYGPRVIVGYFDGTYHDVADTSTTLTKKVWYHVAATVDADAGKVQIFINGQPTFSGTMTGTIPSNTESLYIGRSEWADDHWKGMLDDVRIYDGIVSDSDIVKIFNGTL